LLQCKKLTLTLNALLHLVCVLRPMMEEVMVAEEAPAGADDAQGRQSQENGQGRLECFQAWRWYRYQGQNQRAFCLMARKRLKDDESLLASWDQMSGG